MPEKTEGLNEHASAGSKTVRPALAELPQPGIVLDHSGDTLIITSAKAFCDDCGRRLILTFEKAYPHWQEIVCITCQWQDVHVQQFATVEEFITDTEEDYPPRDITEPPEIAEDVAWLAPFLADLAAAGVHVVPDCREPGTASATTKARARSNQEGA